MKTLENIQRKSGRKKLTCRSSYQHYETIFVDKALNMRRTNNSLNLWTITFPAI